MSSRALRAEFLGPPGGRTFVLLRVPQRPPGAAEAVLLVPPFAEEMNKSRRMMTQLCEALATGGRAAVIADLYGTGDSDGEFEQATWERWVSDIDRAAAWSAAEGYPVTQVVGIRLGCLLAAQVAARFAQPLRTSVFWQPVPAGTRFLEQFLRLRVAASMMEQDRKETVKDLRERLRSGETLEVAGYRLSGALASAVDTLDLAQLAGSAAGAIDWMEVASEAKPPTAPAAAAMDSLRVQGRQVTYHQIVGEPFWTSTEIVSIPQLVTRTAEALCAAA